MQTNVVELVYVFLLLPNASIILRRIVTLKIFISWIFKGPHYHQLSKSFLGVELFIYWKF